MQRNVRCFRILRFYGIQVRSVPRMPAGRSSRLTVRGSF
jgi:hypothetical protein